MQNLFNFLKDFSIAFRVSPGCSTLGYCCEVRNFVSQLLSVSRLPKQPKVGSQKWDQGQFFTFLCPRISEDILFVQNNLTKCFSLHQLKISFSSCVSRLADVLEGFSLREVELFSQTIFILFFHFYICLTVWKKVWHSMLGFYKTESGKLWFARMVSFKNMFF